MSALPPWATGPFELILHGEEHFLNGDDFDRRIALISFDDALEVSITTYLSLHPILRGNRTYPQIEVEGWLRNYHTRLDFLDQELKVRNLKWKIERGHIVWVHGQRNEQYHGGNKGTPEIAVLDLMRKAAMWVFSVLFDVPDPEDVLRSTIAAITPTPAPHHERPFDEAIDEAFGVIEIGGQRYPASELLFSTDYEAYRAIGQDLSMNTEATAPKKGNGRNLLRIRH
jgi:hypothetical protein